MRAEIVTWNPINTRTSVLNACIYIKPTLEILEFFNRSPNHKAVVKIGGTGGCYDNQNVFAVIEKSSDVPNMRDNFYNSTGLYVIVLNKLWYGFPLKNGYVDFQEGIVDNIINYLNTCDKQTKRVDNGEDIEDNKVSLENGVEDSIPTSSPSDGPVDGPVDDYKIKEGYTDMTDKKPECKGFDKNTLAIALLSIALIFVISLNN